MSRFITMHEEGAPETSELTPPKPLIPPLRFCCVTDGIYRGSYPLELNWRYLRRLQLRTIVSITPQPLTCPLEGVELVHVGVSDSSQGKSRKKRGVPLTHDMAEQVLRVMRNKDQHPVYIHCLNGAQVTSLAIGCFRIEGNWSITSVLNEFEQFCDHDIADVRFIESFC